MKEDIEIHYNTLTNEFGDRIAIYGMTCSATHISGEYKYFKTEKSAKAFLNKKSGKAKTWTKSIE